MPIETNLSGSPYNDDTPRDKNYYKILFKPTVSVQVRELHELQTILQDQIEKFGDNIFSRGTIIDGCNFVFYPAFPYIKIKDIEVSGVSAVPNNYFGYQVINESNNLKALVTFTQDGFEATDPDLKTLYLKYLNSGDNSNTFCYTAGDILKVADFNQSVFNVSVNNGGLGFSNSDEMIVTSAIVVNVSTGSFTNGEYITNDVGANLQIINIDTVTLVNTNQQILKLKPRDADLANADVNTSIWALANNDAIRNVSNTVAAVIESIIGDGLEGEVITNGVGRVTGITVTETGNNYSVAPTVRIKSANNTTGLSSLVLAAENYLGKVTVASTANAVGNGYAFGVSEGIIYQKGYFIRVAPQTVIVQKYHQAPNALSVGFSTAEEIINSNIDPELKDNAFITENENAPGADRLKLTPTLTVLPKATADTNTQFFSIVEFSEGNPYKQKQFTQYNKIGDAIAQSISDVAGDFVKDPFLLSTRSVLTANQEAEYVSVVVDPGKAYIDGREISTFRNYVVDIRGGTNTHTNNTQIVSLNYGNYVDANNFAGVFQFNTGDQVKLYNSAKALYANTTAVQAGNTSPVGTQIGTANIRNVVRHPTDPFGWRLYLFNIQMNQGQNFRNTRGIYYDGTKKGIADVIPVLDGATNTSIASLERPGSSKLVFYSGVWSLKNSANNTYQYRTIDQTTATANTGLLTKDISASPDEFFPYSGALTDVQMQQLMVIPSQNLVSNLAVSGTASVNTTTAFAVGTASSYLANLAIGDYVLVTGNSTENSIRRVITIANNLHLTFDSNNSFANSAANLTRVFPHNIPVPFGYRSGLTANVDSNGNILTLNFGMRFAHSGTSNTALGVNIERRNTTQTSKTANRNKFIKIHTSNNAGGVNGPWCLGVPDAFRLRNVYVGDVNVNSLSNNFVSSFYVDHNQTTDYYDLSYLYLKPKAKLQPNTSHYFLVEFDYFTTAGAGFYDAISYVSANSEQRFATDSKALANLTSDISSWEVPEMWGQNGFYYDLLDHYDFRPYAANTVTPNVMGSAPLNPGSTVSFGNTADVANEKKFPVPDSTFTAAVTEFVGRVDSIRINKDGKITVAEGRANTSLGRALPPEMPAKGAMKISDIIIPPYPHLPNVKSARLLEVLNTNVANEKYLKRRQAERTVKRPRTNSRIVLDQPKAYTMTDIAKIDNRLKNVEKYVGLSLLESDITQRVIPSSLDPALDRFKYGFFVDDYSNYNFCDKHNPQFSAIIEDNDLVPQKMGWVIPFEPISGPGDYIDYQVSNQENATVPIGAPPPPCIPITNVTNIYQVAMGTGFTGVGEGNTNTTEVTMAASQGNTATLFFYHKNVFQDIKIYQGATVIKTGADAVALSNTEKALLVSNTVSRWFDDNPDQYLITPVISGNTVKYAGKITWNHNPSSGRLYTIKYTTSQPTWRWVLNFPVDSETVGCPTPPPDDDPPPDVNPPPIIEFYSFDISGTCGDAGCGPADGDE